MSPIENAQEYCYLITLYAHLHNTQFKGSFFLICMIMVMAYGYPDYIYFSLHFVGIRNQIYALIILLPIFNSQLCNYPI